MKLRAPRRPAAGQRTLAFLASALLLSLALSACRVSAFSTFTIKLRAQEKQCFWDKLDRGDRLDLSFEVGSGGSLDIDFWVGSGRVPVPELELKRWAGRGTGRASIIFRVSSIYRYIWLGR